jgi:hypothetical protein
VEDLLDDRVAEDLIKLKGIVRDVMRSDHEGWFVAPVDASALGLQNYHEIIKNPMDLGTVMKKLEAKEYRSQDEVTEDVRLVFNNAMTFNPANNGVHQVAKRLLSVFESKVTKLASNRLAAAKKRKLMAAKSADKNSSLKRRKSTKSMSDVFGSSDEEGGRGDSDESSDDEDGSRKTSPKMASNKKKATVRRNSKKSSEGADEVNLLRQQVELLKEQMGMMRQLTQTGIQSMAEMQQMQLAQISAPPSHSYKPKKQRVNQDAKPLTYQEKRVLGMDINKLPPEMIEGVVKIIQESGAQFGEDSEELEIDIDKLDTPALRKLQKYVRKSLNKAKSQQALMTEDMY